MKAPFTIENIILQQTDFETLALELFQYQSRENKVYKKFITELQIKPSEINNITQIPFLPVDFFKQMKITTTDSYEKIFTSSSTTGNTPSSHYIHNLKTYETSFIEGFKLFYGQPENYCFLALLPGYLKREGSSLVYMADKLIKLSKYKQSGFYLSEYQKLREVLQINEDKGIKTILLGVTFGLLDFVEQFNMKLKHTIVMETGGMKGRRKEMIREEVHQIIKHGLGISAIHSEYGMTELLSQAYSFGEGKYKTPPWMKPLSYDFYNPLHCAEHGKGGINIIDLANIYSCAFIQTSDIGNIQKDGTFEVLGRFDESEIRGCNLMVV